MRTKQLPLLRPFLTLLACGPIAALALPALAPAAARGEAEAPITPLVSSPVAQKTTVPVRGSDGRYHVVYELLVTNTVSKPSTLNSVRVLNAASGRAVASLSAKALVETGALLGADRSPSKSTVIGASESRVLYLSPSFASLKAVPRRLVQRFDVSGLEPVSGKTERSRYRTGAVAVDRGRVPNLRPPLEGGAWLASNACCGPTSHASAMFGIDGRLQAAERFAADWIQIGPDGQAFHGDPKVLTNWVGYGAPIRAAAAGVVTSTHNGRPEQTPQEMPTTLRIPELVGNEVEVRMKGGFTAIYVHLARGSVAVEVGDRVRPGQLLGRLGNSGGTLAPHLHFHIVKGDNAVTDDGYPNTFTSFGQTGKINTDQLLGLISGESPLPMFLLTNPAPHRAELPLDGTLNYFP
jgi:murein DD-endopeptidase MepM/ murein hydrolase activator NlpD